jgi:hypothetical protein
MKTYLRMGLIFKVMNAVLVFARHTAGFKNATLDKDCA